ncbi:SH (U2) putative protein [Nasoule virus]|uniref:Uncharacterized protein n=1 Tax=Nasoule virus TaxID=864695 RepID=A0AAE9BMG5_9RHAB|nr:SH (U2) putative protein [Nasoule virus]UAU42863.1 SH (U2) putative protein [Nasoule virus]
MIALLVILLIVTIIKPRFVEWVIFYGLGHYQFGNLLLYNLNFGLWYLFFHLPKQISERWFGDLIEQYYAME